MDLLKENLIILMIGGGILLAAFNYLFEPGHDNGLIPCVGCSEPEPALYFMAIIMLIIGFALIYKKHFHK